MAITIFYSWQSDSPQKVNRYFIEEALNNAIEKVGSVFNVEDSPRESQITFDKDTIGVPGQPTIAEVIFRKISECGVFVPDLTFVGKTEDERLLMSPNVLIEYGFALNKPSRSSIIAVMNTAYGEPGKNSEHLPFNMRHVRHPITYKLEKNATAEKRTKVLHSLTEKLAHAIKAILESGLLTESSESEPFKMIESTTNPSTFLEEGKAVGVDYDEQPLFLPNVQRLFLRLVPTRQCEKIKSQKAALDLLESAPPRPLGQTLGYSFLRNEHGAFCYHSVDGKVLTLTQLFLNKELWGIDAASIDKQRLIRQNVSGVNFGFFSRGELEEIFLSAIENYLKFARDILQLPLPLKIIAGATDVEGYKMLTHNQFEPFAGRVCDRNIVWESEVNDYNLEPIKILRPFFEHVWEACGLKRPDREFLR